MFAWYIFLSRIFPGQEAIARIGDALALAAVLLASILAILLVFRAHLRTPLAMSGLLFTALVFRSHRSRILDRCQWLRPRLVALTGPGGFAVDCQANPRCFSLVAWFGAARYCEPAARIAVYIRDWWHRARAVTRLIEPRRARHPPCCFAPRSRGRPARRIGEWTGVARAAEQPADPLQTPLENLALGMNRRAILNFSLIVPPTLGRNANAPRKACNQMYPLVEG
jgi:hypothetical protein